jgi:hypothetical protein
MDRLKRIRRIEIERQPDVDAADMAELLVRIDLRDEAKWTAKALRGELSDVE